jgi:hypothetical protein
MIVQHLSFDQEKKRDFASMYYPRSRFSLILRSKATSGWVKEDQDGEEA